MPIWAWSIVIFYVLLCALFGVRTWRISRQPHCSRCGYVLHKCECVKEVDDGANVARAFKVVEGGRG